MTNISYSSRDWEVQNSGLLSDSVSGEDLLSVSKMALHAHSHIAE
jgi:hypothetical protein